MEPGCPRRLRRRHRLIAIVLALIALVCACSSPGGGNRPPSSASTPGPPPGPRPWHLAFSDDFHGTSLDTDRWVTCYDWNVNGCTNSGNRELQWYLPSQVTVGDGTATLTAQRQDTLGSDGKVYPWRSGLLSTGRPYWTARPRFTYTYGYLEASIKFPPVSPQNDFFPAFWLLPADLSGSSETDIVELINDHTTAQFNFQWKTSTGLRVRAPRRFEGPVDYSAGYHTFGLDWEPGSLTWYVDGVARANFTNSVVVPSQPMEILFDLAIGVFSTPPTESAPGTMSIRHVRLWQH